ncbi:MAG: hypothetical protein JWP29_3593 [Rhodoferax sp.]|nr:hypothetical protein [Rhodoferax sp.]
MPKTAVPVKPRVGRPRKLPLARGAAAAPVLGRERILDAALALIDAHGPQAFNIRELAAQLGVAPAAIYWHVPSRNALISGAAARVMNGVADDIAPGRWQDRLRALLHRYRGMLQRHPKLAPLVASEMLGNAAFDAVLLDHVVRLLEDAGFDGAALVDAYNVVIAAMCGFATLELSAAPAEDVGEWEAACRAQLARVDAVRQPALARHLGALENKAFLLRWSSGTDRPLGSGFDAWTDVIVRGLEARARALRRAA